MSDLFVRTVSQGLQAFLPIAVYLAWARRRHSADLATALRVGSAAALLLTPVAGYLFQRTIWQARWEAVLATLAAAITVRAGLAVWRADRVAAQSTARLGLPTAFLAAFAAALILTRQTMEIDAVFVSAALDCGRWTPPSRSAPASSRRSRRQPSGCGRSACDRQM